MKWAGVAVLVVILAVVVVVASGRIGEREPHAPAVATPAADAAVELAAETPPPPGADATAAVAALPARESPISAAYATLKSRADAGSPHAACRLAFELMRCRALIDEHGAVRRWLETRESTAAGMGMADGADDSAADQIEALERQADCRKLPAAALEDDTDYLYRAAIAGVPEAQVRYVSGQMFGAAADRMLRAPDNGYLHHPEFERWRRTAPDMARRLVDAHPSIGLFLLAGAYGSDELPFEALIPDDPVLQWAYVEAVRRHVGAPPRAATQFDAAAQARLADVVRELDGKLAVPNPLQDALTAAAMSPGTSLGDENGGACD